MLTSIYNYIYNLWVCFYWLIALLIIGHISLLLDIAFIFNLLLDIVDLKTWVSFWPEVELLTVQFDPFKISFLRYFRPGLSGVFTKWLQGSNEDSPLLEYEQFLIIMWSLETFQLAALPSYSFPDLLEFYPYIDIWG